MGIVQRSLLLAMGLSAALSVAVPTTTVTALEFRSIDGSGNNMNMTNDDWGQANTKLLRLAQPAYADGLSEPQMIPALPNARAISNAMSAQSAAMPNRARASDWLWQWGQFLDHDLDLTDAADPAEPFNISVPKGDAWFDPDGTGGKEIGLNRSDYMDDSDGLRQQVNQITAYIDGSVVYGSDATRADELRTQVDGKLKTSAGDLLPFNTAGFPNAGGTGANLFLAGDIRVNEQVGLTAVHTLFVREHNRLADEIGMKLIIGDPVITQKFMDSGLTHDEFIYQSARKVVGAEVQIVTYNEFLPTLLGPGALAPFSGYDPTVNASISNEFSTGAYRVGHTMLPSQLQRRNNDGTVADEGHIALRDAFFNPQEIIDNGIDSLLMGLAFGQAQEVDTLMVDDIRNFLFGPPSMGGFDLVSLNIQRGRDHGLPSLNDFRDSFLGMGTAYDSFLDLTGGDMSLAKQLEDLYNTIDEVDLWVGGLAETHVNGGFVGQTFFAIIADQFTRTRDGDRLFYLNELDHLLALDPGFETTTLADIIRRNTQITVIQNNVFRVMPEPTTAVLGVIGLGALATTARRRRV